MSMLKKELRAVIYSRLSQSEKRDVDLAEREGKTPQISSLADQIRTCQKIAKDFGYTVVEDGDRYQDDGISAFKGDDGEKIRPGYLSLLDRVERGDIDFILASEDSRLTRDVGANLLLQAVCVEHDTQWHTGTGNITDPRTADGRLFATIKAAFNQQESDVKSYRVRKSVQRRLEAGVLLGGPRVFGWTAQSDGDGSTEIVEEEAELLHKAYKMLVKGDSIVSITRMFQESGIPTPRGGTEWRAVTIRTMLRVPRHCGRIFVKGVEYPELDKRIVSKKVWNDANAILDRKAADRKRGPKNSTYLTVAKCGGCGQTIATANDAFRCRAEATSKYKADKTIKHAYIPKDVLEKAVLKEVVNAFIFSRPSDLDGDESDGTELADLLLAHSEVPRRKRKLTSAYLASDVMQEKDYLASTQELNDEEAELKQKIDLLSAKTATNSIFVNAALTVFDGTGKVSLNKAAETGAAILDSFLALEVEKQREIVSGFLDITVNSLRSKKERIVIKHKIAVITDDSDEPSEAEIEVYENQEIAAGRL